MGKRRATRGAASLVGLGLSALVVGIVGRVGGFGLGEIGFVIAADVAIQLSSESAHDHAEDEVEPVNVEALKSAEKREPEGLNADGNEGSGDAGGISSALSDGVVLSGREVVDDGPQDAKRQDDQARDEEDGGEQTERVVGDAFESSVTAELGALQEDVRDVVEDENDGTNAMLTKAVGDAEQGDGDNMMREHDQGILVVLASVAEEEDDDRSSNVESGLRSVDELQANAVSSQGTVS